MDSNLVWLLVGIGVIVALAALYPLFYRTRKTKGTDELNWVNTSNYNIAAEESDREAIDDASPAEARQIADQATHGPDALPLADEEFYKLNAKLGGPGTTEEVKDALRKPS